MKLIVHGQQAFGKAVLEAVLDKSVDEVVAVYSAPDKEGRPLDPLKECALEKGLSVYQPVSYKDPAVWEQLGSHGADLCVMAYVLLLVPEEALNVPRYGSIQYHPSLLPMHKGPSSINWFGQIVDWILGLFCCKRKWISNPTIRWDQSTSTNYFLWVLMPCWNPLIWSGMAMRQESSRTLRKAPMKAGAARRTLRLTGINPPMRFTT